MKNQDHQDFLNSMESFRKEIKKDENLKKAAIKQKMLDDLKKKHFLEKKQEIEQLKKRLELLEMEVQSYE